MNYLVTSDDEMTRFGAALASTLEAGDALLLRGDLGAGKSVLARGVARALGVTEPMPSPTFTLVQPHEGAAMPVYHFDLYRMADLDEFYAAGLDEMIDAGGVCLIEWPLDGLEPLSRLEITIERCADENARRIAVDDAHFARGAAVRAAIAGWEVGE